MKLLGRGSVAALLALLLCAKHTHAAIDAPGPIEKDATATIKMALDPLASVGKSKGGALCLPFATFQPSEIEKEIDPQAYQAMLSKAFAQANLPAAGISRMSGLINAAAADICWPYVGFDNTDKIKGLVRMSVSWQISSPETGGALVTLVTQGENQQTKAGPGGLKAMLRQAFAANIHQLISAQAFRLAMASPAAAPQLTMGGATQSLKEAYAELCSAPDKAKGEACATLAQALATRSQGHGAEPASTNDKTSAAGKSVDPAVLPTSVDLESPEMRINRATGFLDQLAGRAWTNGETFTEFQWVQRGALMTVNSGNLGTYAPTATARIEISLISGAVSHLSNLDLSTGTVERKLAGSIRPDGALRFEPADELERGQTWRLLAPDQFEYAWDAYRKKRGFVAGLMISRAEWADMTKAGSMVLWPIDLAKAHAQKRRELDAAAAQQQAARSQERAAQRANQQALYNVLQGELAVATANEAESRANMEATLEQINAQAAAQREAEAQAQRQLQVSGQQRATQMPGPSDTLPQPALRERGQTNGVLLVESAPQAGSVRPTLAPEKNSGEEFIYCVVLRSGDFDRHNGARYFSEIAPITVDYGRPLDGPPRAFLAEVKTAYNLPGGSPGCRTSKDRAALERMRQEDFDSNVFRSHKNVMTNIVPRN